jgi:hypothetical protein
MGLMDNIKTDASFIPSYSTINEASYLVLEAIEEDYNEMMRGFALQELAVLEATNTELIYEAKTAAEAKNKINGFVKGAWAKDKGQYEHFLKQQKDNIDKLNSKVKVSKVKSLEKAAVEGSSDKVYAKSYTYKGLEEAKTGNGKIWKAVAVLVANASKVNESNLEEVKNQFAKAIGASSSSTKDIKTAVINYLRGSSDKSFEIGKAHISKNYASMVDYAFNYKVVSSDVKKVLNTSKSAFDSIAQAAASKEGNDVVDKATVSYLKFAVQTISLVDGAILTVYKEEINTNRKAIWKFIAPVVSSAAKSAAKEASINDKAQKEVTESATNDFEEHEAIFDWGNLD